MRSRRSRCFTSVRRCHVSQLCQDAIQAAHSPASILFRLRAATLAGVGSYCDASLRRRRSYCHGPIRSMHDVACRYAHTGEWPDRYLSNAPRKRACLRTWANGKVGERNTRRERGERRYAQYRGNTAACVLPMVNNACCISAGEGINGATLIGAAP